MLIEKWIVALAYQWRDGEERETVNFLTEAWLAPDTLPYRSMKRGRYPPWNTEVKSGISQAALQFPSNVWNCTAIAASFQVFVLPLPTIPFSSALEQNTKVPIPTLLLLLEMLLLFQ